MRDRTPYVGPPRVRGGDGRVRCESAGRDALLCSRDLGGGHGFVTARVRWKRWRPAGDAAAAIQMDESFDGVNALLVQLFRSDGLRLARMPQDALGRLSSLPGQSLSRPPR